VFTADTFDMQSPEAWENFLSGARQTCPVWQLPQDAGYVIATYDENCAAAVNPRQFPSVRKVFGAGDPELAALAQFGDIQLELIRQHGTGSGAGADLFGTVGLNHVATFAIGFDAQTKRFEAAGAHKVVEQWIRPAHPVAFMDTRASIGYMVEMYTDHPRLARPLCDGPRACGAVGWPGSHPGPSLSAGTCCAWLSYYGGLP
jgi:hypothetical protein